MSAENEVSAGQVETAYIAMQKDAAAGGYFLNPEVEFTRDLIRGILINQRRYGYGNCPCRLASGNVEEDRDMICPCDYRDADVAEFGTCY